MTLEHSWGEEIAGGGPSLSTGLPGEQAGIGGRLRCRLRRSNAEKRALVEMATQPGSSVTEVAACFEVAPSQIYAWRKQLADGDLADTDPVPAFTRVDLAPDVMAAPAPPTDAGSTSRIVIAFPNGAHVRIDGSVDPAMLALVLSELGR